MNNNNLSKDQINPDDYEDNIDIKSKTNKSYQNIMDLGLNDKVTEVETIIDVKEKKKELLYQAIEWHNKHREIADSAGKQIAHINLGQT